MTSAWNINNKSSVDFFSLVEDKKKVLDKKKYPTLQVPRQAKQYPPQ